MHKGKIFILSGPSGAGKTTIYKRLLKRNRIKDILVRVVTYTTRSMRPGEVHGKDYFFISKKMFLFKQRWKHFLECQKVFENYYGTPRKQVEDILKQGQNVLLCIDVKGAHSVAEVFPDAVKIFIMAPSFEDLCQRLKQRASEDPNALRLRIKTAKEEIKQMDRYDYIVINDDIKRAVREVENIIVSEALNLADSRH